MRRPEWKKGEQNKSDRGDGVLPLISVKLGIYSGAAEVGWWKPLWEVVNKMLGELRS